MNPGKLPTLTPLYQTQIYLPSLRDIVRYVGSREYNGDDHGKSKNFVIFLVSRRKLGYTVIHDENPTDYL